MRLTAALLAQSSVTKLDIRAFLRASGETGRIENEIVDAGIDDEAIEAQQPHVVTVGRGPTKLDIEHHVATGHVPHRTWCDACMRAVGIVGSQEKRDPLVAMDCGYFEAC